MHPPDLKMLETNSGVRGSGGSFRGKSQASSSNTTEGTLSPFDIAESLRFCSYNFICNCSLGCRKLTVTRCCYGWSVDNV